MYTFLPPWRKREALLVHWLHERKAMQMKIVAHLTKDMYKIVVVEPVS